MNLYVSAEFPHLLANRTLLYELSHMFAHVAPMQVCFVYVIQGLFHPAVTHCGVVVSRYVLIVDFGNARFENFDGRERLSRA